MSHPLKSILGSKTVSHFSVLGKIYGVNAGLFLAQLCFWDGKGVDPDWTYKTEQDIYDEIGMTDDEQVTARNRLVKCGVINLQRRGNPYRYWFRVNFEVLEHHLSQFEADSTFRAFADKRRLNRIIKAQPVSEPTRPSQTEQVSQEPSQDSIERNYHPPLDEIITQQRTNLSLTVHRLPENTTDEFFFTSEEPTSTPEMWDSMTSASCEPPEPHPIDQCEQTIPASAVKNNEKDNGLVPILDEEKFLFEQLNLNRTAKNYSPYKRFNTVQQRLKFRECVTAFNGFTNQQVEEIIANGRRDLDAVVNALHYRLRQARKEMRNETRGENKENAYALPPEQFVRPDIPTVDMTRVIIQ